MFLIDSIKKLFAKKSVPVVKKIGRPKGSKTSAEARRKQNLSKALKKAWASKTPAQRKAWLENLKIGRELAKMEGR